MKDTHRLDLQSQSGRYHLSADWLISYHWLLIIEGRSKQVTPDFNLKTPRIRKLNMFFTWVSVLKITLLLLLVAAVVAACLTLPIEKVPFLFNFTSGSLWFSISMLQNFIKPFRIVLSVQMGWVIGCIFVLLINSRYTRFESLFDHSVLSLPFPGDVSPFIKIIVSLLWCMSRARIFQIYILVVYSVGYLLNSLKKNRR